MNGKNFLLAVFASILLVSQIFAFKFTDYKQDSWNTTDKLMHLSAHTVLTAFLYSSDATEWGKQNYWTAALYSTSASIGAGFSYEFASGLLPRGAGGFSIKDLMVDAGGSVVGVGMAIAINKFGSRSLHKTTSRYRNNKLARFSAMGLLTALNYTIIRTSKPSSTVSNKDLFYLAIGEVMFPVITLTTNRFFFFPKIKNVKYKNLIYDIAGSITGALIARQFIKYNSKFASYLNPLWETKWY